MLLKNIEFYRTKRFIVFILTSLLIGFLTLLIALKVAPWFFAINIRVRFYLSAPSQTQINICWDEKEIECSPLVPYSMIDQRMAEPGEEADVWLGELPARPEYSVSLVFDTPIMGAKLSNLEIDSSQVLLFGSRQDAGIPNLHFSKNELEFEGIESKLVNENDYLTGETGGRIRVGQVIIPGPDKSPNRWIAIQTVWGLVFSIYLLVALPVFLLPELIANLGSANRSVYPGKYPLWIFLIFGTSAAGMLFLTYSSGAIFNQYDPLGYLYLALGGGWFNDARLPGYPLFLGLALSLSQFKLEGAILLQVAILSMTVLFCLWILRKWIHPVMAVFFIILILFSPAQIHWARWILRESLFASIILIGITTAIAHFTSHKPFSNIWLGVFTLICGLAFLIRENGILLPVALFPFLIPQILACLKTPAKFRDRIRTILFLGLRYCSPVLLIGIIYLGFSYYNFLHYGYFQVGLHQTSHSFLVKAIYPANSDVRSLITPGPSVSEEAQDYFGERLYRTYIIARNHTPGLDPIYVALYPTVSQHMVERNEPINSFHIGHILNEIGKGMYAYVPWEAKLAGLLRQYREVVTIKNDSGNYPLQVLDPSAVSQIQDVLDGYPLSAPIKLANMPAEPNRVTAWYYQATQHYQWYGMLLFLSLLSSIYIVKYGDPVFLAPMAIFVANGCLLIFTRLVTYRYLVSLDVLLILQMVLGLSLLINRHYSPKTDPAICD